MPYSTKITVGSVFRGILDGVFSKLKPVAFSGDYRALSNHPLVYRGDVDTAIQSSRSNATSAFATALGSQTVASGQYAMAYGLNTRATSSCASAEGSGTIASGDYSHAEGLYAETSAKGAHAEGNATIAASQYQHASGKYNVSDSSNVYAEIVGNGIRESARSNARTLDWEGNAWHAGDVVSTEAIVTTEEVDGEPVETTTYEEHHLNRAWTGKYATANLHPFFSDPYIGTPADSQWWYSNDESMGVTDLFDYAIDLNNGAILEDGWARVSLDAYTTQAFATLKAVDYIDDFIRTFLYSNPYRRFTLLAEVRNVVRTSSTGHFKVHLLQRNDSNNCQLSGRYGSIDGNTADSVGLEAGVYRAQLRGLSQGGFSTCMSPGSLMGLFIKAYDGFVGTFELRLSLYDATDENGNYAEYQGDYVPFDPESPKLAKLRHDCLAGYKTCISALMNGMSIVRYEQNDGTGAYFDIAVPVGLTHKVKGPIYASETKVFSGWNTSQNGSGTSYSVGDSLDTTLIAGNEQFKNIVRLYAQWTTS